VNSYLDLHDAMITSDDIDNLGEPDSQSGKSGKEEKIGPKVVKHPTTISTADLAVEYLAARKLKPAYWRGELYRYTGKHYEQITDSDLKADVNAFLQGTSNRRMAGTKTAAEIIANIEALALVPASCDPPAYLLPGYPLPLPKPFIPLSDGVLDVEKYLAGDAEPLQSHSPEWFFLNSLPYGFGDLVEKKCETWRRVLSDNLPDPAYQYFLQEWFGLLCIPDTTFEHFMLFPGEAGTGKTVTCTVLRAMLGAAAVSSVPLEAFNPSRTFPLAATVGKLANISEEIGEIDKAAEGLLKQYVSGSPIQVERKHRDPFWLKPTARLTFATNVLPRFADRSNGVWRRLLILPFEQVVPVEKRNRRLIEVKFWESSGELPGILAWSLEGLARLRKRGHFEEPIECRTMRENYKREANPAAVYLQDHCSANMAATVPATKLYKAYSIQVKEMGHHPLSEPVFAREVRRLFPLAEKQPNPTRQPDGNKVRLWLGIQFNE